MNTDDLNPQQKEAKLIDRLRHGDAAALEHLYLRHIDRLYSVVFHQVGKNKRLAEDILQDTFITAIKYAGRFDGSSSFYVWLCGIAQRRINGLYRRRVEEASHNANPTIRSQTVVDQGRETEYLENDKSKFKDTKQAIEQALSSLPQNYRQVLIMKYIEEMPIHEISHIMRRPPKTVEELLTRARSALQNSLSNLDEIENK
jgi:RNA polymerase sigma-70 factor (ECF subfamily)